MNTFLIPSVVFKSAARLNRCKLATPVSIAGLALFITACGVTTHTGATKPTPIKSPTTIVSAQTTGVASLDSLPPASVPFTYVETSAIHTPESRDAVFASIDTAADAAGKLNQAANFLGSMDFQFLSPAVLASAEGDESKTIAVREFFEKIRPLIADHSVIGPSLTDPSSMTANFQKLCALSATLHFVNLVQAKSTQDSQTGKAVSMLKLIEDGLRAKAVFATGIDESKVPSYALEVLRHEQDAIYMLELRQNDLKWLALTESANLANGNDFAENTEFQSMIQSLKTPPGKTWEANYNTENFTQLNSISKQLEYAIHTQGFLKKLAIPAQNAQEINTALSLMNLPAVTENDPAKISALNRLASDLKSVLAN